MDLVSLKSFYLLFPPPTSTRFVYLGLLARYATQHVDFLRLNPTSKKKKPTSTPLRIAPIPSEFARKKPISTQLLETHGDVKEAEKKDAEEREGIARREEAAAEVGNQLGLEVRAEKEDGEMSGKEEVEIMPVDAGEIDWFAYYLAVSPRLSLSNPPEPPRHILIALYALPILTVTTLRNSLTTSTSPILSPSTQHRP